jgi:hypothetical protein
MWDGNVGAHTRKKRENNNIERKALDGRSAKKRIEQHACHAATRLWQRMFRGVEVCSGAKSAYRAGKVVVA